MRLTPGYLCERLRYDAETGKIFWREAGPEHFKLRRTHLAWNTRFAGQETGALMNNGYLYINLKKQVMPVHRVIMAIVNGYWPEQVDHIDHDRVNNRWTNLRDVTASDNARNTSLPADNTSGRIGVYWFKQRNIWYARIKTGKTNHHLGYFTKKEDAIAARSRAEIEFKFHNNHGVANENRLVREAA